MHPDGTPGNWNGDGFPHLGRPDDIDVSVELRDWLFALEGREGVGTRILNNEDIGREERCWHTNFRTFRVIAKSTPKNVDSNGTENQCDAHKYPVDSIIVSICTPFHCSISFPELSEVNDNHFTLRRVWW
jgi:hypothetical protein